MTSGGRDAGAGGFVPLNESELRGWGAELGRAAGADAVFVALYGELGAGKSTLVRAACRSLGVAGQVPSPTFTLVNLHEGEEGPIHHVDLYRLEPPVEPRTLIDAGWPEVLEADGPVFVEWADRAGDWLPPDRWDVRLRRATDPKIREVSIEERGAVPRAPRPGRRC
ncbi:MAG TPA: tRNA (adenosine(37)-N6)-threonylcarbamoyltransferase complex ATPase subunit type 1 TsaE [Gemmatimonadota bacterium]|nr:tRNA (adenosine(37)-N6)-threonylcarbamoyltransferase complex ATPase subunit type 1 TsaE [Gemmatimonadota bacterium]